ncbi:unnamed protein product [Chrysoparadoxa australica]
MPAVKLEWRRWVSRTAKDAPTDSMGASVIDAPFNEFNDFNEAWGGDEGGQNSTYGFEPGAPETFTPPPTKAAEEQGKQEPVGGLAAADAPTVSSRPPNTQEDKEEAPARTHLRRIVTLSLAATDPDAFSPEKLLEELAGMIR